jgi:hypothetical protein
VIRVRALRKIPLKKSFWRAGKTNLEIISVKEKFFFPKKVKETKENFFLPLSSREAQTNP